MSQRQNYAEQASTQMRKMFELTAAAKTASIGQGLIDLVNIRASQMNGCAFCLDMHVKEAKIHGERELRVHHVSIWRESGLFTPAERAALAWTEAATRLADGGVADEIYREARAHFSEKELADLTFVVAVINAWNRLAVSFRSEPGSLDAMLGLTKAGLN